jgi:RNA polymerase sigma factor for flagellar operon FliA
LTAQAALANAAIAGDKAAQDLESAGPLPTEELIRVHLPLVHHLVRDLLGRIPSHVRRDELVSAGMLALVTSAQSFDPARGVVFARYAAIRIRGALTDELRSMDWASRTVRARAREVDSVSEQLSATGHRPTTAEVAAAMGVPVSEVNGIAADVRRAATVSLQALPGDGADRLSAPGANPESIVLGREQMGHLRDAIAELPERLRYVVECYFFQQRKMADIAAELGVTESRVSQIRSEALGMMRDAMRAIDGSVSDRPAGDDPSKGREALRAAYVAAVATRSTLASRLEASSVFDQSVAEREDAGDGNPLAVAN